jgi:hypothetical protein
MLTKENFRMQRGLGIFFLNDKGENVVKNFLLYKFGL